MYKIQTSKIVDNFLAKHSDIRQRVLDKLEILAQNPYKNTLDIQKLQGRDNRYRLRVGKYRILYEIIENQILIYAYDADSRGGIYK
ncbi:MAG: type II toxin-antitoxin system RelE/ParE family toxin [Helicobacter sp.]|nr:type II toxin-antitoxin system RelE/ParE family toxin [Helicobacter sp.]MDE6978027.1 type II toxin-antitoxin system RelE/ParE family toxin [Helicobacter sp.]